MNTRRRLVGVLVVVMLLFCAVVVRLTVLQILSPEAYAQYGAAQRMRVETLSADRGAILDRNGVELAVSVPRRSVFVDPKLVVDAGVDTEAASRRLAEVLGIDPAAVRRSMQAEGRFSYIARHLDDAVADRVQALHIPGVSFVQEPVRFTPSGELGRSIVGLTDIDGSGINGLEQKFGEQLTGTPGRLVFEQTPEGKTIPVGDYEYVPASKGNDLILTLDRSVQFEVERILGEGVKAADAKGGIAIVMRPDTGEILAMANMVNDRQKGEVTSTANNAALTTVYEPGSVMKIVTATGAIEDGVVTPDTHLVLPPFLQFGPDTIKEAEPRGTVNWSVAEIIQHSSNIGTITMAQKLGKGRVYDYLRAFGFGEKTAIGFPNEQNGFVLKPEKWWLSSIGTIPIGQGVSVTPLQMLQAYNVVADSGAYVPPRLVRATVDASGMRHPFEAGERRRVVSQETSNKLNVILRSVVSAEGTGRKAAVEGYTVAGKTGTARKPQPTGGYADANGLTQYEATFVGFAPAEAPAVSVIVVIDEPGGGNIFGGSVAAPVFSKIMQSTLRMLEVPPPASDGPAGGVPAHPEDQAKAVALGPSESSIEKTPDGRIRAPAAGQPVPGQPVPSTTTTTARVKR